MSSSPTTALLQDLAKLNGHTELPPDREAAVEYGLKQFQQIGHERDRLNNENAELRDKVAAIAIENKGLQSQLNEAISQVQSMIAARDKAVAERVKYEALFVSVQAQMRAFKVPIAALIKDADA